MGMRIRNFFALVLMLSFPFCIFVMPLWWHTPQDPRVVVAVTTTIERLEGLQPILDALLSEKPDSLFFIVSSPSNGNDEDPIIPTLPPSLKERIVEFSATELPHVKVLYSSKEYGSSITSSVIASLLEERLQQEDESRPSKDETMVLNQVDCRETRILILDDRYPIPSIRSLVQASLKYPEAILSTIGGNWRSHFRQIKWILEQDSPLNQFPNIALHNVKVSHSVDLLDSSRGVIFRAALLLPHLELIIARLDRVVEQVSSHKMDPLVLEPDAGDILWCGIMESLMISRRIVPSREAGVNLKNTTTAIMTTAPAFSRRHWMTAVFQLQQEWNIWKEYTFWDWSKMTQKQHEVMECEGRFQPDCVVGKRSTSSCLPNPQHCGDLTEFR